MLRQSSAVQLTIDSERTSLGSYAMVAVVSSLAVIVAVDKGSVDSINIKYSRACFFAFASVRKYMSANNNLP